MALGAMLFLGTARKAGAEEFGFSATLLKAEATADWKVSEPLFESLQTSTMTCADAERAYSWLKDVRLDEKNDGQMQVAARHARYVALALARATSPDCRTFIATNLKDETRWGRFGDVKALMGMAAQSRKLLFEGSINGERIRGLIAAAGNGKNEEALETLRSIEKQRGIYSASGLEALGHIGHPKDLDRIIVELKSDPRARHNIAPFGTQVIPRIMKEVNDPKVTRQERDSLIGSMKWAGGHESLPEYVKLLQHPDPFVSRIAAEGIARVALPEDIELLKSMRNSSNINQRQQSIYGMSGRAVWRPEYSTLLIDSLVNDGATGVRSVAADKLGELGVCEAVPALEDAAALQDKWLSGSAQAALSTLNQDMSKLPGKPNNRGIDRDAVVRSVTPEKPLHLRFAAGSQLAYAGYLDDAFPILKDVVLSEGDRLTRYDALYILWEMGDRRSKDVVIAASKVPALTASSKSFLERWVKGCQGFKSMSPYRIH